MTAEQHQAGPPVTSLDQVLNQFQGVPDGLKQALMDREDNIADMLRLAGAQYGTFPQIVAEVLCQVGLGTPPTTEERAMIHNQFHAVIEELRRQFGVGDDPTNL